MKKNLLSHLARTASLFVLAVLTTATAWADDNTPSIACDNEYTEVRILGFQRIDEAGNYVNVSKPTDQVTGWTALTPGTYMLNTVFPVYIVDTRGSEYTFLWRETWPEYFFHGGRQKNTDYLLGDFVFYFDVTAETGQLLIQTASDYPLVPLTIESDASVTSINLPINVSSNEIDVNIYPHVDSNVEPILLEEGRKYEVIANEKLVFTGAVVTKTDIRYYPPTYNPTYFYTITVNENDGKGSVNIAKEPPVSITLSVGAGARCEQYDAPGGGGDGWGGNGPYYEAGEYTFYNMGEELVITGAKDVSVSANYTYTFTAAPGAVINIRLASEANKASINISTQAEELLTQWEFENEGNIDWDGNGKYKIGEYTFTFSNEVEITGVAFTKSQNDVGSYVYTFTPEEDAVVSIYVPIPVQVTFAAAGYATYYNSQSDAILPEGVTASIVTGYEVGLTYTLTYQAIEGNIVPAGVAVMLYSNAVKTTGEDTPVTLTLTGMKIDGRTYSNNLLHGSDEEATTTGALSYYKLTYGDDSNANVFGWYWGENLGEVFTNPANRAYLALNMSFGADEDAKRRFFPLPTDTALGIENIAATGTEAKGAWYTLSGVKLNGQPQLKGIYIRDGKKFIIK